MSKFFIQMLFSLAVAVSAAVGFSPDVKGIVSKTLREAKTFAQEITGSIFQASGVEVEAEASVSTEESAETSLKTETEGELESESETNANLELDKALNDLSETSVGTLLSAELESEVEAKSDRAHLDLEKEIESQLDLGAAIGK